MSTPANAQEVAKRQFDLPAGAATKTLRMFSQQSGRPLIADTDLVREVKTNEVKGEFSVEEAMTRLLDGTGLVASKDEKSGAYTVKKGDADPNAQRAIASSGRPKSETEKSHDGVVKLDTFEVMGTKLFTLNMDKPRSRDDAQPYVVFDRQKIDQAQAINLEDFLKTRLPMNTVSTTFSQGAGFQGNLSQINLRGLGTNQTLILVDGHRMASPTAQGVVNQSDLNGIPMSAIERIEILPTTASGIYGGSATGGVINIILRRDYAGAELKVTYENTFDRDAGIRRVDLSAGFTLEHGKTDVLLAASYTDGNVLATFDRDFVQRGRSLILTNNPSFLLTAATPTLGATSNVRSANGSTLVLKNGTSLNSPITYVPAGYAGTNTDGGAALAANAGKYNFALASSGQQPGGGRQGLLNTPREESFTMTVRRQFSPVFQAFVEAAASNNASHFAFSNIFGSFTVAASAPNNPFNQDILVTPATNGADSETYASNYDRRLVGGVIVKLPREWSAEADYTWNRSRMNVSQPTGLTADARIAIGNGTLDVLRDSSFYAAQFTPFVSPPVSFDPPFRSTLEDATLRLAGPVRQLPAGALTLAMLLEHRSDNFSDANTIAFGTVRLFPSRSQSVSSGYLEARIPLFSTANKRNGFELLELQVAGRRDDYAVHGVTGNVVVGAGTPIMRATNKTSSTNPTVGLRYQPVRDLMLRASYGTGFLPPSVSQVLPSQIFTQTSAGLVDPRRGNTQVGTNGFVQSLTGGNPDLRPEESKSWSAGAVVTPRVLPGLRLSLDYTRIDKTNNIATFASDQQLIDNEAIFPSRVVRGPVSAGDPFNVGPITVLDETFANFAKAQVEAYDFQIDYQKETAAAGSFDLFAVGTWQTHYKTQFLPSTPIVENAGVTSAFPLKFKANAGVTWKMHSWTVGWLARYFGPYVVSTNAVVVLNQGAQKIPSQVYHDLFVGYTFERSSASAGLVGRRAQTHFLADLEVQAGIKNLLNSEPPVDVGISSSRYYSPYGDPRLASYYISVKKAF